MKPRTLRTLSLALLATAASAAHAQDDYVFLNGLNGGAWDASLFSVPNINWLFGRNPIDATPYTAVVHFGRVGDGAEPPSFLPSNMNYASISLAGLAFDTNRNVSLTGNLIRLKAGATVSAQLGTYSIANALELNADSDDFSRSTIVDVADGGILTCTGIISGGAQLQKRGGGTLVLSGANTYRGGTVVGAGILRTGSNDALSGGGLALNGGTLDLAGATSRVHSLELYARSGPYLNALVDTGASKGALILTGDVNAHVGVTGLAANLRLEGGAHTFSTFATGSIGDVPATIIASGDISGAGSLVKAGPGTLVLSGTNSYAGGTTLNAGALKIGSNGALAGGDLQFTGGTLDLNGFTPTVRNLTLGAPGTDTAFTGVLTDTAATKGALGIAGNITLNTVNAFTGYHLKGNLALQAGQHTVGFAGAPYSDYDLYFDGVVSGAGGLTLDWTGQYGLALTAANTYAGATILKNRASLLVRADNALPTTTALQMESGTSLYLYSAVPSAALATQTVASLSGAGTIHIGRSLFAVGGAADTTFSGNIVQNGPDGATFVKQGSGALTLSGANTYVGTTKVAGGVLRLGSATAFAKGDLALAGGDLDLGGYGANVTNLLLGDGTATAIGDIVDTGATPGTLNLGGNVTFAAPTGTSATIRHGLVLGAGAHDFGGAKTRTDGGADVTFTGSIAGAGSLVKTGTSTYRLSGANAYTGGTTVSGGRLVVERPNGTYLNNATLEVANDTVQTLGAVTGTGAFVKSGAGLLALAGPLGNTGGLSIEGGTLAVGGAGTFDGAVSVATGANLANASGGTVRFTGRAVVQGEVATLTGSTTVFDGLVSGAGGFSGFGTVDFQGGYNPGNSPASVRFQGDLRLSSFLRMELGGTALGTGYDHLAVDGSVFLGGALDVVNLNGFSASFGQSFDLFDFSSSNGAFSSVSLPTLSGGLAWNTSALYTTGTISVQAVPEPATLLALGAGALGLLRRRARRA